MVREAFGDLRLHRVQTETPTLNQLRRVGFEHYGVARSYVHIAGRWQDNVLYQLLTPAPQTVVSTSRGLRQGAARMRSTIG